jgi:lysophospholipase L1-like esterase
MNRFLKVTVWGSLGIILAIGIGQKLAAQELNHCPPKDWISSVSSPGRSTRAAFQAPPCDKTASAPGAQISRLFPTPFQPPATNPTPSARFTFLPSLLGNHAASGNPVRPRTGGQLYLQRVAAVRAGQLYSHILPENFLTQWQTAWEQPTYQQWQTLLTQEAAVMAARQGSRPLTILLGDSLYLWLPQEHLTTDRLWLNQSISGETTGHILRRLDNFAGVRADEIYVMAGINDLKNGADPRVVVSNIELIAQKLRVQHPQARIIILSILPTRLPPISNTTVRWVNQRIAREVGRRGVEFVDLQPDFMDSQGLLRIELTTDGIHLSPQGYRLLAGHLNAP